MIKRIKKLSYQDWITGNTEGTDPIKTFWIEKEIVYTPVKLHTFIKRKKDYLFITEIAPFEEAPYWVEGYSVTVEQQRHYKVCQLFGEDL